MLHSFMPHTNHGLKLGKVVNWIDVFECLSLNVVNNSGCNVEDFEIELHVNTFK
jgi:hypothetical protein